MAYWLGTGVFRTIPASQPVLPFRFIVVTNAAASCQSNMGKVTFPCPKTATEFDSGFQANSSDLTFLPRGAKIAPHCPICGDIHEFKFADARTEEGPLGHRSKR